MECEKKFKFTFSTLTRIRETRQRSRNRISNFDQSSFSSKIVKATNIEEKRNSPSDRFLIQVKSGFFKRRDILLFVCLFVFLVGWLSVSVIQCIFCSYNMFVIAIYNVCRVFRCCCLVLVVLSLSVCWAINYL